MTKRVVVFVMRALMLAPAGLLASLFSPAVIAAESGDHGHHHPPYHQTSDAELKRNAGQPWQTDAPLREAMMRIRQAAEGAEHAAQHKQFGAAEAHLLAKTIRDSIAYMVANCQLPPDADATLHALLGRLASAAAAVENAPTSADGLPKIHQTLRLYPQYFADADWSEPEHQH